MQSSTKVEFTNEMIVKGFGDLTPNEGQLEGVKRLLAWYQDTLFGGDKDTYSLGGYAGTGKTTILNAFKSLLVEHLSVSSIGFVSLTGRAVLNMQERSVEVDGLMDSYSTIHSLLYRPKTDERGNIIGWKKVSRFEIPNFDLLVNDEASMTNGELQTDLEDLGIPILYVGDHGQLPPVKSEGKNVMENPDFALSQVMRQALDSPIIKLATMARKGIPIERKPYGPGVQRFNEQLPLPMDIEKLMLTPDPETIIITDKNLTRVKLNQMMLQHLDYEPFEGNPYAPFPGARIIFLRNRATDRIYNGQLATVVSVVDYDEYNYSLSVRVDDDPDTVREKVLVAKYAFNQAKPKQPEDPDNRMLYQRLGVPADFGYAITCHKSQGSEWKTVFVCGVGFGPMDMRKRWLYTALTRARTNLYIIK